MGQGLEVLNNENNWDVLERVEALTGIAVLELQVPLWYHDHLPFEGAETQMGVVFTEIIDTFLSELSLQEIVAVTQMDFGDHFVKVESNSFLEELFCHFSLVFALWHEELLGNAQQFFPVEMETFCHKDFAVFEINYLWLFKIN